MDNESILIFKKIGIIVDENSILDDLFIPRELLLNDLLYNDIKPLIMNLKTYYSSSFLTSLHQTAHKSQKWPLLNLVRQILNTHNYKMIPIRKADGYTVDGVKKYKRFFHITKKNIKNNEIEKNQNNIETDENEILE